VYQKLEYDAPVAQGQAQPQQGDGLLLLQITACEGSGTSRHVSHDKAGGSLRESGGTGGVRQYSCLPHLPLAFVYKQEGWEDRGWHRPRQISQVTGMVGREVTPGIGMRPLQLRKTGQHP
jgi:hypothetical protein